MKNLFFIFILVFLYSCTEPPPSDNNPGVGCSQSQPEPCWGADVHFEQGVSNYFSPIYNPNNPNEFMYIRKKFGIGLANFTMTLEKYNFFTETNTVILDSMATNTNKFNTFNWGSGGHVTFEAIFESQIFKVNDNGLNLTQLTFNGINNAPNFTFENNKIFFSSYTDVKRGILMDIDNGSVLDSVFVPPSGLTYHGIAAVNADKIVFTTPDNNIRIMDENFVIVDTFVPDFGFTPTTVYGYPRVSPLDSNHVYLFMMEGIFKINLNTHQVTKITEGCIKEYIKNFSISPDGLHILYEVQIIDWSDPCDIVYSSEIHMMNIDGSNNVKIELP
jgi:hypothetical protein